MMGDCLENEDLLLLMFDVSHKGEREGEQNTFVLRFYAFRWCSFA